MREAIAAAPGPVVAVSPLVGGRAVKGPTEAFIAAVGRPVTAAGVASLYTGLLDGMVVDAGDPEPGPGGARGAALPDPDGGRRPAVAKLAERALEFARGL